MKRTILFGGSFDPVHNGHLHIATKALEAVKADKVIFILAKNPRWKNPTESSKERLEMLEIALKDHPAFEISTYELENDIYYSIDTVRHFKEIMPDTELYFLIGDDQVNRLGDWYKIDDLAGLVTFLAYGRKTYLDELNIDNREKYRVGRIEGELIGTSSTDIRNLKSIDVPEEVLAYILEKGLYFGAEVQRRLSEKRYKHSCSVALLARQIARKNDVDAYQAFMAGLFHDIAKEVPKEEKASLMNEYFEEYSELPKFAYHQFLGALLARKSFGIEDEVILDAIASHATGKRDMSPLGMIIYASDKIEPLRKFDSSKLIEACMKDYFQGFIEVLAANRDFLLDKKKDIDNCLTKACMQQYLQ